MRQRNYLNLIFKHWLLVHLVLFMVGHPFSLAAQSLRVQPIDAELSQAELAEMTRTLLYQKRQLAKLYGEAMDDQLTAKVFGDFGAYSDYSLSCCNFQPITTAYYNQAGAELVIFKNEEFMKAFRHELCHALTAEKRIKDYPWLDEGLAEVLSAKQVNENGEIREQLIYAASGLKAINVAKIRKLLRVKREAWQQMTNADSYAMAWALVNYLDFSHTALLSNIILATEHNANLEEVIEKEYKGGLKTLVKAMRSFYRKH